MFCSIEMYGYMTIELIDKISHHLFEDFYGGQNWHVFPDVIPFLENMQSAGITLGVISNFDDRLRGLRTRLYIM